MKIFVISLLAVCAGVVGYFNISSNQDIEEQLFSDVAFSNELKQEENVLVEEQEVVTQKYTASNGKEYEIVAKLSIPALGIEYPVLATSTTELLKISLNKYWGANPNEVGNCCIIGHNYNDNRFFGKLHDIKLGESILLADMKGRTLEYSVYDTYSINPEDTSCTSQLTNGETEITLITCTRDFKQRFIVKARAE